ncbi:hypothetical protein P154DRAFT_35522 [Amniculicola lignicola CBS 123094]|uniref:DUF7730 domain-containing protein n=1 Tax=Amniculicola lignicola CBS 123094 TaxID=1392246 RepID=A0A6A5WS03_9PLEO|nr:hypothetical protein P154DRAFT_35522 [Amniculicola lignicola CBS 123094]
MGLLLTCRQSYVDILTLIYTHKVFLISDISTLLTFSLSLPINHMNNIRSLHLTVEISGYGEFLPHHTMSNLPSSYRNLFPFLPPSGVSVDGSKKMYPYTWLAVCATLARMEGLRRLWIDIQFNYNPLSKLCDKPPEDLIFQPLMSIARVRVAGQLGELDVFKVLVNWKAGDTAWEEKGIPFVLKRELAVKRLPATAQIEFHFA